MDITCSQMTRTERNAFWEATSLFLADSGCPDCDGPFVWAETPRGHPQFVYTCWRALATVPELAKYVEECLAMQSATLATLCIEFTTISVQERANVCLNCPYRNDNDFGSGHPVPCHPAPPSPIGEAANCLPSEAFLG